MPAILNVTYTYSASAEDWAAAYTRERAEAFLAVPGLIWKIWLDDTEKRRSGGTFLFETRGAAEAFLASPAGGKARANPNISDLRMEVYDVREAMSAITHGPLAR